ncbi:hypothetical protein PpBr36_01997 [Pyricularia pennisetigena]|uniref:hypothetical protein n=1 Tax=Pyricularia pennisetigena TaxID=1578925 RepID=UPI00114E72B8|nr:hypothetical protein PpBr36_01997 [Pyricularia pennisetigena]TLS29244.1 hypothetical protein PpBr36_01997 [Pyricularia pennisetigena]
MHFSNQMGYQGSSRYSSTIRAATTVLDSPDHYAIGWIAALSIEAAAAVAMLDEEHGPPSGFVRHPKDSNVYKWGRMGEHNIVITSLPAGIFGTTSGQRQPLTSSHHSHPSTANPRWQRAQRPSQATDTRGPRTTGYSSQPLSTPTVEIAEAATAARRYNAKNGIRQIQRFTRNCRFWYQARRGCCYSRPDLESRR